jgi:hypothetical protein
MTCPWPTMRRATSSRSRDAAARSASRPSADDVGAGVGMGIRASRDVSGQDAGGDNEEGTLTR